MGLHVIEEGAVADDAGFDGFLEAGAELRGWECGEDGGVGEDGEGVVEGADEVLAAPRIHPGFAADRGVDLRQQRGRDLDEWQAA